MVKAGYNAVRRNRNIGTARQRHGRSNAMKIPCFRNHEKDYLRYYREWWEILDQYTIVKRNINHGEFTFFIEQTHDGYRHACTIDDICDVLALVPAWDLTSLRTIVLRQPTRKQRLLEPAWGRLAYSANLGRPARKPSHLGPAIFLDAVNSDRRWWWSKNLDPFDSREIERLKADGHVMEDTGRVLLFRSTLESVRATQLYRTLLHEIGHWVDWEQKVERPSRAKDGAAYEIYLERYFARPEQERETFAHRYAELLRRRLQAEGLIHPMRET